MAWILWMTLTLHNSETNYRWGINAKEKEGGKKLIYTPEKEM